MGLLTANPNPVADSQIDLLSEKRQNFTNVKKSEKYVNASDFIEIQIQNVIDGHAPFIEVCLLIKGLMSLINLNRMVEMFFRNQMQELLFFFLSMMHARSS